MIYIISGIILLLLLLLLSILIEFKIQVIYDQGELRIKWQGLGVIQGRHTIAAKGIQAIFARPPGKNSSQFGSAQSFHSLKSVYKLRKYININELRWYTVIGTGDAMYTALAVGSMWSLKAMLIAAISQGSPSEKLFINIQPDFEKQRIYSELNCIFKLRMVHIMLIAVHIIWLKIRRYRNGYTAAGKPQPSH